MRKKAIQILLPVLALASATQAKAERARSYYAWEEFGGKVDCYQVSLRGGEVINSGKPEPEKLCEAVAPSHYEWRKARHTETNAYCYHLAPDNLLLNDGKPVEESKCEAVSPSHYKWYKAGYRPYAFCAHFTPQGHPLEQGMAVDDRFCERAHPAHYEIEISGGKEICYKFTPQHHRLNRGEPVALSNCTDDSQEADRPAVSAVSVKKLPSLERGTTIKAGPGAVIAK